MTRKPYTPGRIFIGRFPKGSDLLEGVTRIANEEGIDVGTVSVQGSLARLVLTLFDQQQKMNRTVEPPGGVDIASLSGTISRFKGRALAKLGGTFLSPDGDLFGGTVTLGTEVYACEVVITEMTGGALSRDFDMETGLPLWKGALLIEE